MLTYHPLTRSDQILLRPILKAAFDEDSRIHTSSPKGGPTGYENGILLQQLTDRPNSISKSIFLNHQLIGAYVISFLDNMYVLDLLFLDPDVASRGIGSQVWRDIERDYASAKLWVVETPDYSLRNHHFYEKNGFCKCKEYIYSEDCRSYIYVK